MKTFFNYIRESVGEVRHIKWPTRNEAIASTVAVIVIAFAVAYYLNVFLILSSRAFLI